HGIGLKAAAQRIEHAGGDITESESALGGFGAVDGDVKLGIIELLLDAKVGYARHLAELPDHPVGKLTVALNIGSLDLYVDGRRYAEVQDLADHVGGQEVKRRSGEFAIESAAQLPDMIGCYAVLFLKRNQYVGVGRSDRSRCAVHIVDVAIGHPDI